MRPHASFVIAGITFPPACPAAFVGHAVTALTFTPAVGSPASPLALSFNVHNLTNAAAGSIEVPLPLPINDATEGTISATVHLIGNERAAPAIVTQAATATLIVTASMARTPAAPALGLLYDESAATLTVCVSVYRGAREGGSAPSYYSAHTHSQHHAISREYACPS